MTGQTKLVFEDLHISSRLVLTLITYRKKYSGVTSLYDDLLSVASPVYGVDAGREGEGGESVDVLLTVLGLSTHAEIKKTMHDAEYHTQYNKRTVYSM